MRWPQLTTALSVASIVGLCGGALEGAAALSRNLDAPRFALVCATAPVLPTTLLACLVALPLAGLARLRGRRAARAIADHAGVLVGLGVLSVAWPVAPDDASRGVASGAAFLAIAASALAALAGGGLVRRTVAIVLRDLDEARLRRRLALLATGAGALALLSGLPAVVVARSEGRRVIADDAHGAPRRAGELDVVLVTIDTLRADRVAGSLTPAIDRLASQGAWFANAISASSWTMPSVASILSGRLPPHHGAGASEDGFDLLARTPLSPAVPLLPEVLHERGYLTSAIVTNPYLSMRYGFGRGFDRFENVTMESEAFLAARGTLVGRLLAALRPAAVVGDRGEVVSERAIAWIERHRDEKFFLWLHYLDPHAPYGDPSEAGNKSLRGDLLGAAQAAAAPRTGTAAPGSLGKRFVPIARLRAGEIHLDPVQRRELVALYDAGVRYADRQLGRVLAELDRLGLAPHSLVVVAGDHGEEFWEHGGVEHGHTMYEEIVHVPLVLRWPGGPAGMRVGEVASLVDVAPTIADLAGAPDALGDADGRSLRATLAGAPEAPRVASSEGTLFADDKRALRGADFKVIVSANGKQELYDLAADPGELRDLAGSDGALATLRERATAARASLSPPPAADPPGPAPNGRLRAEVEELRDRLRALGYVP